LKRAIRNKNNVTIPYSKRIYIWEAKKTWARPDYISSKSYPENGFRLLGFSR
jgi:hypothetical protein